MGYGLEEAGAWDPQATAEEAYQVWCEREANATYKVVLLGPSNGRGSVKLVEMPEGWRRPR